MKVLFTFVFSFIFFLICTASCFAGSFEQISVRLDAVERRIHFEKDRIANVEENQEILERLNELKSAALTVDEAFKVLRDKKGTVIHVNFKASDKQSRPAHNDAQQFSERWASAEEALNGLEHDFKIVLSMIYQKFPLLLTSKAKVSPEKLKKIQNDLNAWKQEAMEWEYIDTRERKVLLEKINGQLRLLKNVESQWAHLTTQALADIALHHFYEQLQELDAYFFRLYHYGENSIAAVNGIDALMNGSSPLQDSLMKLSSRNKQIARIVGFSEILGKLANKWAHGDFAQTISETQDTTFNFLLYRFQYWRTECLKDLPAAKKQLFWQWIAEDLRNIPPQTYEDLDSLIEFYQQIAKAASDALNRGSSGVEQLPALRGKEDLPKVLAIYLLHDPLDERIVEKVMDVFHKAVFPLAIAAVLSAKIVEPLREVLQTGVMGLGATAVVFALAKSPLWARMKQRGIKMREEMRLSIFQLTNMPFSEQSSCCLFLAPYSTVKRNEALNQNT